MPPGPPCSTPSRRALYRHAKRTLYKALVRPWTGSRASLDKQIRAFLRGKRRSYLLRLARQHAFALIVAGALLTGATAHASPPIELSDVAAGTGGFVINGIDPGDWSGIGVSGAGDVNGDGLADLIVGTRNVDPVRGLGDGESYVVFGKADGAVVELADVTAGTGGFVIIGTRRDDIAFRSVSGAGDVNGDGLADLIVGAPTNNPGGASYVVFGKADGAAVELSDNTAIDPRGFVINGIGVRDFFGGSVSGAGDVNGDGFADLIVGAFAAAPGGDRAAGKSYVVFGKANGAAVELSDVAAGTGGFVINGIDMDDFSGGNVSGAGDVNGDGLADLIVGARTADPGGDSGAGESYVVFGKTDGTAVELSDIAAGTGGFVINGIDMDDFSGRGVSGAGDVNGDGLADLIVGATGADPGGDSAAGESYVVFGKGNGAAVELSDVAGGTGGFVINGIDPSDRSGRSVSGAGDVNGDGLADLIVGAYRADSGGAIDAGESYVVFGKTDGTAVELSAVASGTGGFVMNGIGPGDRSGLSLSGAGDVNGDGLADLIVGAPFAHPGGANDAGESYVVFSPEIAPASAFYQGYAREGDGPGGDPVVPLHLEDARMTIDYSDDDTAAHRTGGPSLETVILHRGTDDLRREPTQFASTYWRWITTRRNWDDAEFTFKYLDSDVADLSGPESTFVVYTGLTTAGPWVEHAAEIDPGRNTASLHFPTRYNRSYFAIASSPDYEKWVDFAWDRTETGSRSLPYDTLQEALEAVPSGGGVVIKGNTADSDSPETFTGAQVIDQAVRITAVGGTVTIGNSAARDARPGTAEDGFVSKKR